MQTVSHTVPGNLGNTEGAAADGVLIGQLTATDPDAVLLKSAAATGLCITDDGGLYVNETTPWGESTGDDVELLPATPADDDAVYIGHATIKFAQVDINLTTQGDGTWTIDWEYWDGSSWTALSGVTDNTTGFTAATGWKSVTFTEPGDWAQCTIDSVLGYWVRGNVSGYSAVTTAPQAGQGYVVLSTPAWTDDTTDFTDAGAGDVACLPAYPIVGDGLYIGYSEIFCKVKITTSQARTGTATLTLKYWDGSAWTAVTAATLDDDSVGYSATAGTHYIHFTPPTDWTANTAGNGPNGETGFFVVVEMTAMTDVTQQPLATQGWVLPLSTGADGIPVPISGQVSKVDVNAGTASAANADSKFLLCNVTAGTCKPFTWTKADPTFQATVALNVTQSDKLALVQITEDGTTEFADATFQLSI